MAEEDGDGDDGEVMVIRCQNELLYDQEKKAENLNKGCNASNGCGQLIP